MGFPVLIVDTETTGLNPETCQVIEVACLLDHYPPIKPIVDLPSLRLVIRHEHYSGEATALAMHHRLFEELSKDTEECCHVGLLGGILRGFVASQKPEVPITLAGKNVSFDVAFLAKLPNIKRYGNALSFEDSHGLRAMTSHRYLDPSIWFLHNDDTSLPNINECLKRAGLVSSSDHTALGDCYKIARLLRYPQGRQGAADQVLSNLSSYNQ